MDKIAPIVGIAQHIVKGDHPQMWLDYDREADVLYICFQKPMQADDSIIDQDDIVSHYQRKKLVGLTILHASKREH